MNRRDNEELTDIPQMKPAHDEVVGRRAGSSSGVRPRSGVDRRSDAAKPGGSSLTVVITLLVAVAALGASYFLWEQSRNTQAAAQQAEARIAELESQLTSTGDELSQSDAAVRVKLRELDSEVRKLWDSRKKANKLAGEQDKTLKTVASRSSSNGKKIDSAAAQLTALSAELDEVVDMLQAADFESQSARLKQSTEQLQRISGELSSLSNRVATNEEWVESINAFRRQVNERLNPSMSNVPASPQLQ